jgi:glycosyltransferase involved in cell wall biosynthesis
MAPVAQQNPRGRPVLRRPGTAAPVGVVIPVRNGHRTIGSVLRALARQQTDCTLHVVVVVDGSRDDTRSIAEQHARQLRKRGHVCEILTAPAGRAHAIRAGEAQLGPGLRLYVDCDAVLSENAVSELTRALAPGSGVHFASPRLIIRRSSSLLTRAYFRTWSQLPYVQNSPVTYGVYAVSAEGRARWAEFPLIHSDDKFARLHFEPEERRVVAKAAYEITPPDGLRRLVLTRRRYLAGNRELERAFPRLVEADLCRHAGALRSLTRTPPVWPSAPIFFLVYALALALDWST